MLLCYICARTRVFCIAWRRVPDGRKIESYMFMCFEYICVFEYIYGCVRARTCVWRKEFVYVNIYGMHVQIVVHVLRKEGSEGGRRDIMCVCACVHIPAFHATCVVFVCKCNDMKNTLS